METKVVNLFAGPGVGKSTTAAGLFHLLKINGIEAEYVPEEAKDMVWEERHMALACQPYIFGKQLRNIERLMGKVEVIVTDSPILLSVIYNQGYPSSFNKACIEIFKSLPSINYFLSRTKDYNPVGRNQTEAEALKICHEIYKLLTDNDINFSLIDADSQTPLKIFQEILDEMG